MIATEAPHVPLSNRRASQTTCCIMHSVWSRDSIYIVYHSIPKIYTLHVSSPCSSIYYEDMHVLRLQQRTSVNEQQVYSCIRVRNSLHIETLTYIYSYFSTFNNAQAQRPLPK